MNKIIFTKEAPKVEHTFTFSDVFINKNNMSKKITTQEFVCNANKIHGNKYDYSLVDYKSNNVKVKIICSKHGLFEQRPNDHISKKTGCSSCCGKNKNTEVFINELKLTHGDLYDYSKVVYSGIDNNIEIICKKHGSFLQSAYTHRNGSGCPKCNGERVGLKNLNTLSFFINKSIDVHGNKYDYSLVDYKKGTIKVKIICPNHGIFEQIPDSHLRGRGCPVCKESMGEKMISKILSNLNVKFERQHKFDDCIGKKYRLPFDFYLQDYNLCIEYDGEQHFKFRPNSFGAKEEKSLFNYQNLINNDKIKNEYCTKNNINLLRIKFDEIEENIVNKIKNLL